jgi:hypothetical protein
MHSLTSRICSYVETIGCLVDDPRKTMSSEPCFAIEEVDRPGYCKVVEIAASGRYGAVCDTQKVLSALESNMASLLAQDEWIRNAITSTRSEKLLASTRRWLFRPQIWEILRAIDAHPVVEYVPSSSAEMDQMIM